MKPDRCVPESRSVSVALRAALSRYNAIFAEEAGRSKVGRALTSLQLVLLDAVAREETSQTALREQTGIDRSTLSEMIMRLEKHGLVETSQAKGDSRMTIVKITAEGKKQLDTGTLAAGRAERRFLGAVTDARLVALRNTLNKLGT